MEIGKRNRIITIVTVLAIVILFLAYTFANGDAGGQTADVIITAWETSERYTDSDIMAAIRVAEEYFNENFEGCTLTEITYAGDDVQGDYADWAKRNNADEAIVLISSFDVDESGGDGSLNPNTTYENWNWILVRNTGGEWRHVDHGY